MPTQPSSAAAARTAASVRADRTTSAPSARSASAVARPSPREPPVTMKTLPPSSRSMSGRYDDGPRADALLHVGERTIDAVESDRAADQAAEVEASLSGVPEDL